MMVNILGDFCLTHLETGWSHQEKSTNRSQTSTSYIKLCSSIWGPSLLHSLVVVRTLSYGSTMRCSWHYLDFGRSLMLSHVASRFIVVFRQAWFHIRYTVLHIAVLFPFAYGAFECDSLQPNWGHNTPTPSCLSQMNILRIPAPTKLEELWDVLP